MKYTMVYGEDIIAFNLRLIERINYAYMTCDK